MPDKLSDIGDDFMPMNETIRAKRKELSLTQEQVAEYLGVSAPAVNKWEKGSTCPDITLLSALARLLGTDVNTLLGFHEGLSPQERGRFQNAVAETVRKEGFPRGFEQAMAKVREYPGQGALLHETALLLDGALMMFAPDIADRERYEKQILALYERAADCGDEAVRGRALFMLASKCTADGQYDKAQELIDRLPDYDNLDKRQLQARLLQEQGKSDEAAELLTRKLHGAVLEVQNTLFALVSAELRREDGDAESFAHISRGFARLFHMGEYSALTAPLEVAVAKRDAAQSLTLLRQMLSALMNPWGLEKSPLYRHLPTPEKADTGEMGRLMLPTLLAALEREEQYEFLHSEPEFQRLVEEYRAKS